MIQQAEKCVDADPNQAQKLALQSLKGQPQKDLAAQVERVANEALRAYSIQETGAKRIVNYVESEDLSVKESRSQQQQVISQEWGENGRSG